MCLNFTWNIVIVDQGSEIWAGSGGGETKTGTEKERKKRRKEEWKEENNSEIRPEV